MTEDKSGLTYEQAGVDRRRAARAIGSIEQLVGRTLRPGVLGNRGGFAGAFDLSALGYREPVLLAGADGVGTKIMIAEQVGRHDTVGIDLVAMCANDVLVHGGEPLFFLDYIAMGRIEPELVGQLAAGVAEGCVRAGCALLGGETAELPGMYSDGAYELAGFCVGAVERDRMIDGRGIGAGDAVIGLPSSGLHSNGFSLVRRTVERAGVALDDYITELGRTLGEELLEPTRIYVKPVLDLLSRVEVNGLVHITGGGLVENVPRIVPGGLAVRIELSRWTVPPVFSLMANWGQISDEDMFSTFNMGLGFIVIAAAEQADRVVRELNAAGVQARGVGEVSAGDPPVVIVG